MFGVFTVAYSLLARDTSELLIVDLKVLPVTLDALLPFMSVNANRDPVLRPESTPLSGIIFKCTNCSIFMIGLCKSDAFLKG